MCVCKTIVFETKIEYWTLMSLLIVEKVLPSTNKLSVI